jgi:hypothetical protein
MAAEEVPAPAKRDRLSAVVDIRSVRGYIHFLSAGNGERSGWLTGSMNL